MPTLRSVLVTSLLLLVACSSSPNGGDAGDTSQAGVGGSAGTGGAGGSDAGASPEDAGSGDGSTPLPVAGAACVVGDFEVPSGTSDILAADGCNRCSCSDGVLGCTRIACPAPDPDECLVAVKLDECCARYRPATRAQIDAEECLVPYPDYGISAALAQRCIERSSVDCRLVDCAPDVLPSRLAASDGQGGCTYRDECTLASDCVRAIRTGGCCACYESTPRAVAEAHRCLRIEGSTLEPDPSCPACTLTNVLCGGCPEPTEPTCVVQDSWNECR